MNNVKKSIGWPDYTINPVRGLCPMGCDYCYARQLYKRFKWDERLTYHDEVFTEIHNLRKPSRIFVGSTMELFHENTIGVFPRILEHTRHSPWHTFIFLTKQPQNLPREFPDNCWVGVSATNGKMADDAGYYLEQIDAKVRFISIEPLLEPLKLIFGKPGIHWVIIGQQTPVRKATMPKIEWVREIVEACDKAGIPVFLKDNLGWEKYSVDGAMPFYKRHPTGTMELRQEFPR